LILYSLLWNNIEGLESGCSSNPASDINDINNKLNVLKGVKPRVDEIETKTKQNTEALKKFADELADAGSKSLGGFSKETKVSGLE